MIECLNNFVGIRHCSNESESGLWVNDLPGMSTELVDKIATTEQRNFAGVWDSVQRNVQLALKDDIISELLQTVNFNAVIYQTLRPKKQSPNTTIEASTEYKGVYIELGQSKFTELNLKGLWLYNNSGMSITTDIKVFDVNDGTELFTQSVEIEVGFQYIPIKKVFSQTYSELRLFICVDSTQLDTLKFVDDSIFFQDCEEVCCQNGYNEGLSIWYSDIQIGDDVLRDNLSLSSSGGITIDAQINCSIADYICQNKYLLKRSYQYRLAAEILYFKLGSPKLNYFTSSNLENTALLRESFIKEYKIMLKNVVKTIPLTGESICFNCEDKLIVSNSDMMA